MKISELALGEEAEIIGFLNDNFGLVLSEMGFTEGAIITLASVAPLGDPLCISTDETLLSIRVKDADFVQIKKLS